jgi:hypothetical protein
MASALEVEPSVEEGSRATVVAYTAPFDREHGAQAAVGLVDVGGRRTVAHADAVLTAELLEHDGVGTTVVLSSSERGNTMRGA